MTEEELLNETLKINEHTKEVVKFLEEKGYDVLYVGYIGAHNYGLADEQSDYDFKAIVLPDFESVIRKKSIGTVYQYEYGQIDTKDLMTYTTNLLKGNFSYLEALHSTWYIDFGEEKLGISIRTLFKDVKVNYMSMFGSIMEYRRRFNNKLEDSDYDNKSLVHAIRLYDLLDILNDSKNMNPNRNLFDEALTPFIMYEEGEVIDISDAMTEGSSCRYIFSKDDLIKMKRKPVLTKDEAIKLMDYIIVKTKEFVPKTYHYEATDMSEEVVQLLVNYYKNKLVKGE